MPVKVSFMRPGGLGSINAVGVGNCRATETISLGGTTTLAAQDGEIILLVSNEAVPVIAAHGLTPNAAATAQTPATSAGYGLPSGLGFPVAASVGDRVNVQAFA